MAHGHAGPALSSRPRQPATASILLFGPGNMGLDSSCSVSTASMQCPPLTVYSQFLSALLSKFAETSPAQSKCMLVLFGLSGSRIGFVPCLQHRRVELRRWAFQIPCQTCGICQHWVRTKVPVQLGWCRSWPKVSRAVCCSHSNCSSDTDLWQWVPELN